MKTLEYKEQRKDICTPYVIRSKMVPSFCRFELSWTSYGLGIITKFVYVMCFCTKLYNALYWRFQYASSCRVFTNQVTTVTESTRDGIILQCVMYHDICGFILEKTFHCLLLSIYHRESTIVFQCFKKQ